MPAACAIDFGTSNSTLALVQDGVVRQLPLDPRARTPTLMPTLMYFLPGRPPVYGTAAIEAYLENELEGRLIQSVKRHLPSTTFDGTSMGRSSLGLEHLIAGFLRHLRGLASAEAGEDVTRVLLGRPARFAPDAERDELAESRLRRAAEFAGFTDIAFQVEPVAAARSFEQSLDREVLCFVGDLGGGTSDFTLIRLGPGRVGRADRTADVLGVAGIDLAGNDVDARLVWTHAAPYFGVNARYAPAGRWVDVPTGMHHAMTRWHTLCQASTPANLNFLDRILQSVDDRPAFLRLRELIAENVGYLLFRAVEGAKVQLGDADEARIRLQRDAIDLDERVTREAFEASIGGIVEQLAASAQGLLDDAGVRREDVDVAFLTGGTAQLRPVRALFDGWFEGRMVDQDTFTSVGVGLGVEARERFAS